MVSSSHEAMHRIFQEDPGIFAHTFDRLGIPFRDPVAVTLRDEVRERVLGRADADLGRLWFNRAVPVPADGAAG